ncbi:hypothetical protein GBF38_005036 [Nibea albiflora]|uniref:Uncharacterized protein n=1 Tax=Nibea albiflora TaxID=240163 RepID=A0ACB7EVZ4_NIBAL|nr:hypothetical protein GBF38_005036 [Nibea albiflora]
MHPEGSGGVKRSEVTGRAGEAKGHRQRVKCPEQRDEEEEEGGEPRSSRQSETENRNLKSETSSRANMKP